MQSFPNFTAFKEAMPISFDPTPWLEITQDMVDNFAKATLDFQWIHTDPERAKKESPFGGPIAHGFLSVSLLSGMLEDLIEVKSMKMGVNYGLNKVRFPQALPVGSQVRLNAEVGKLEPYGENGAKITWNCSVEIQGKDKPACVAEFITLMFE
ncbi:MAG: MaoC family dehydratase [Bacteroidia bacterium]|nr:MaoC family dehydratase [Bacteroidia bacterium]